MCNPFYTLSATHPHKDRLTIVAVLQNTRPDELRFRFNATTRQWLAEWKLPRVMQDHVAGFEDSTLTAAELTVKLETCFWRGPRAAVAAGH